MTTDIELRKLAEAATPGPWENDDGEHELSVHSADGRMTIYDEGGHTKADAAYIAAANPAAILSLLDRLEKAEKALEQQKEEWLSWQEKRDALEKDAGRYRFLSADAASFRNAQTPEAEDAVRDMWNLLCDEAAIAPKETLDAAIDAAMEATK